MGKAVEVLDEMLLAGVSPDEHTYTNIMHGYASIGDTGKAFEYFTRVKNEGLEIDVYAYEALLKACCKSGRMQSALAVTKEMSAQNIPRNTFVYNILIDGYGLLRNHGFDCFTGLLCFVNSVDLNSSHSLLVSVFLLFLVYNIVLFTT